MSCNFSIMHNLDIVLQKYVENSIYVNDIRNELKGFGNSSECRMSTVRIKLKVDASKVAKILSLSVDELVVCEAVRDYVVMDDFQLKYLRAVVKAYVDMRENDMGTGAIKKFESIEDWVEDFYGDNKDEYEDFIESVANRSKSRDLMIARHKLGVTQEELAQQMNLEVEEINDIEFTTNENICDKLQYDYSEALSKAFCLKYGNKGRK